MAGRGGVGVVYRAFDPVLGRMVALKVPHPETLSSAALRRRFLREAEAAGRLCHPGIVTVFEVRGDDTGCYIATEYCEGPTLAAWLLRSRTEPMTPRDDGGAFVGTGRGGATRNIAAGYCTATSNPPT